MSRQEPCLCGAVRYGIDVESKAAWFRIRDAYPQFPALPKPPAREPGFAKD